MKKSISNNIKIIDFTISIISIMTSLYVYMNIHDQLIRNTTIYLLGIIALVYMVRVFKTEDNDSVEINNIKTISNIGTVALVNEENQIIKEWDLFNKTALVIGRNSKEHEVDIDLSEATYASLIDPQHAVLNFASGSWYIEDLYSRNGISIEKIEDKIRYKLSKDKPCTLLKGDVVFIAKTKLLIR
ncbi:MAG: FHA domain-containing protein [Tepidibacter sp.]|uniref:FHA domain-containing protein n=1 Tax=Tepidibacter sp. TaxID=2529387 RepID=UPI0025F78C1E|nr:FHA domain-containing protein [Tepidibacter sp.]MCT4509794.1 FHA domain-containing protein [Tepidibacter sp.]